MKRIRQPIVSVLGHVDHGKCLLPDEFVLTLDYGVIKIRDLFDLARDVFFKDDTQEIRTIDIKVPALREDNKVEFVRAYYVWRIKHSGKIIRVKLENGLQVGVTPEHPFLTPNGWKKAEDLHKGDLIAIPLRLPYQKRVDVVPETLEGVLKNILCLSVEKVQKILEKTLGQPIEEIITTKKSSVSIPEGFNPHEIFYLLMRVGLHTDVIIENGRSLSFNESYPLAKGTEIAFDGAFFERSSDLFFIPVKDIIIEDYDGYVYDLTTETHNFIANGIIVHNTTLLDKIRGTSVAQREAGLITQHIGATEVPVTVIKEICGPLIGDPSKIRIPGLLFIDTPGHRAFTNLRARGGSLADLAILVVDVMEGFMPQTLESINILKRYKTPFVLALNKIDRIRGWVSYPGKPFVFSYQRQKNEVKEALDLKVYETMSKLAELGFDSDIYFRISDFTRKIAIIPLSAKTGEGIPDLLAVLIGLAQRYLEKRLEVEDSPGEGTILEIKEIHGMGTVADVIFYDGVARVGDNIAFITRSGEVKTSKIRGMMRPKPLVEIREVKTGDKLVYVEEVSAAAGVRLLAEGLEDALPGGPIKVYRTLNDLEKIKRSIIEEATLKVELDKEGIVVKADTLGSLEALVFELKENGIKVKRADIGDISKRDLLEVLTETDILNRVIVGFNVKITEEALEIAEKENVKVILGDVIYRIVEDLTKWREDLRRNTEKQKRMVLVYPCKFKILPEYIFRTSKPAIVGIRVLTGSLRPGVRILRPDGAVVGIIKSMQSKGRSIDIAYEGDEVAIAIDGVTIGRQLNPGDEVYVDIPSSHAKILFEDPNLDPKEREILEEIAKIKRKKDPFWGI